MKTTKLYKYEVHFGDSPVAYDRGVVELTSEEIEDAIYNPDWEGIEPSEGRDYEENDCEVQCTYYCAPDGAEMSREDLLDANSDDLIEAGWVSDWLSNVFDD